MRAVQWRWRQICHGCDYANLPLRREALYWPGPPYGLAGLSPFLDRRGHADMVLETSRMTQVGSGVCIAAVETMLIFAEDAEQCWSGATMLPLVTCFIQDGWRILRRNCGPPARPSRPDPTALSSQGGSAGAKLAMNIQPVAFGKPHHLLLSTPLESSSGGCH